MMVVMMTQTENPLCSGSVLGFGLARGISDTDGDGEEEEIAFIPVWEWPQPQLYFRLRVRMHANESH